MPATRQVFADDNLLIEINYMYTHRYMLAWCYTEFILISRGLTVPPTLEYPLCLGISSSPGKTIYHYTLIFEHLRATFKIYQNLRGTGVAHYEDPLKTGSALKDNADQQQHKLFRVQKSWYLFWMQQKLIGLISGLLLVLHFYRAAHSTCAAIKSYLIALSSRGRRITAVVLEV